GTCYSAPNICSPLPELWAAIRSASQLKHCQLVALDLRERHHTCLASSTSTSSTCASLRQWLALRSASSRVPAPLARLYAVTPLGQNLLGGCAAKWITTQWL